MKAVGAPCDTLEDARFRFDRSPRCVLVCSREVSWRRRGRASDATLLARSGSGPAGPMPRPTMVDRLVAVQSWAGRPPVGICVAVTRPAACRAWSAWSIWPAGWLWLRVWLIWLRVSPPGCCAQGGVDLFGERFAGRAGERPRGGPGGVVVQRERGGQVRRADLRWPSARA